MKVRDRAERRCPDSCRVSHDREIRRQRAPVCDRDFVHEIVRVLAVDERRDPVRRLSGLQQQRISARTHCRLKARHQAQRKLPVRDGVSARSDTMFVVKLPLDPRGPLAAVLPVVSQPWDMSIQRPTRHATPSIGVEAGVPMNIGADRASPCWCSTRDESSERCSACCARATMGCARSRIATHVQLAANARARPDVDAAPGQACARRGNGCGNGRGRCR